MAWEQNFAVSYVSLKSSGECPFHRLDLVYKAIAAGILPPLNQEERNPDDLKGMANFLRIWYTSRFQEHRSRGKDVSSAREEVDNEIKQIDTTTSISFRNAVVKALKALAAGDDILFDEMCQWLLGEDGIRPSLMKHGVNERVDKTTAFKMIRSLGQVVRQMGYSGLIVLLDEAEMVSSLSTKQREQHLSNLRELIDECGLSTFQGMMLLYAVPDENFLDGRTQVYEALRQRLSTQFDDLNPYGVRIELEKLVSDPESFLADVGKRIAPIFALAHNKTLDPTQTSDLVAMVAELAHSQRFAFDQGVVIWSRFDQVELVLDLQHDKTEKITNQCTSDNFSERLLIEAMRMGIVPDECVSLFTVGRDSEVSLLKGWLTSPTEMGQTIVGSYGTGKTHLLRYFYQYALKNGYAVSFVEVDPMESPFSKPKSIYNRVVETLRWVSNGKILGFRDLVSKGLSLKIFQDHPYFGHMGGNVSEPMWQWIEAQTRSLRPPKHVWVDREHPALYPYTTTANIYTYLISSLSWLTRHPSIGLNGLLVIFDEAESVWWQSGVYGRGYALSISLMG